MLEAPPAPAQPPVQPERPVERHSGYRRPSCSVRQPCHAGKDEAIELDPRDVAEPDQRIDQGAELLAGDLAGRLEEMSLAEEVVGLLDLVRLEPTHLDRKSTRLNSSHPSISY